MTTRVDLRDATRIRVEGIARVQIFPTFGDFPLSSITQPQVQQWVASLTVSPATIARAYGELRLCLSDAVNAGLLVLSPCRGIKLPRRLKQKMVILDHDEVARLAAAIEPRYRSLIYLLAYGGLRISEAAALLPEHIDLAGRRVLVERTSTLKADGSRVIGEPKTRAGVRWVPLPTGVMKELEEHLMAHPDVFVFTGDRGANLHPRNFGQRNFARAIARAALNEKTRVHDLRHTAVTMWIRFGVDLPRIAAWAGHTNPSFTLNQYASFFPKDDTAFMDALDEGIIRSL